MEPSEQQARKIEKIFKAAGAVVGALAAVGEVILPLKFDFPRGKTAVGGVVIVTLILTAILWYVIKYYGDNKLLQAFFRPLRILGIITSIFFLFILIVLFVRGDPSEYVNGVKLGDPKYSSFNIVPNKTAEYSFTFDQDADYAEVKIMPKPGEEGRLSRLSLIDLPITHKESGSGIKQDHPPDAAPNTLMFSVEKPTRTLSAIGKLRPEFPSGSTPTTVDMVVKYEYWRHDYFWRIDRWVHTYFGEL